MMPNTRRILIVDDDPELRDALSEQLSLYEEFEAVAAEDGSKGVQAAKAGQIDLVIMDVGLPDIDGREAVRILRRNGFKAPIIMERLTADIIEPQPNAAPSSDVAVRADVKIPERRITILGCFGETSTTLCRRATPSK